MDWLASENDTGMLKGTERLGPAAGFDGERFDAGLAFAGAPGMSYVLCAPLDEAQPTTHQMQQVAKWMRPGGTRSIAWILCSCDQGHDIKGLLHASIAWILCSCDMGHDITGLLHASIAGILRSCDKGHDITGLRHASTAWVLRSCDKGYDITGLLHACGA